MAKLDVRTAWRDLTRDLVTPASLTGAGLALIALGIQLQPGLRDSLIFDRGRIAAGEWWRLWTGHLVHFGWPHFLADTGLLLLLGWTFGRQRTPVGWYTLPLLPLFIAAAVYFCDPGMQRYAGLSAVNLGLLLMFAIHGWRRQWTDWFWPAILLIYVGEVVFEVVKGGRGGGMIEFDDPSVRVATGAHVAAAVYAALDWVIGRWARK